MPSQEDETGDVSAVDWVKNYIKVKYEKPGNVYLGLLHRIDRPAGGILLLAKTSKAAERMSKQFHERKIEKLYWAITERIPNPPEGTLVHFLRKMNDKNIVQLFQKELPDSKIAELSYRTIQTSGKKALLEVNLKTGRKHQIRAQLASIKCPIVGDVKYGVENFLPDLSVALLARKISFEHPVVKGQPIEILAPVPNIFPWNEFQIN